MHSIRTYLLQALADPAVRGSAQFGDAALLDAAARANTNDPAAMIAAIAASVAGHAGALIGECLDIARRDIGRHGDRQRHEIRAEPRMKSVLDVHRDQRSGCV